jgi:hypothetical protein
MLKETVDAVQPIHGHGTAPGDYASAEEASRRQRLQLLPTLPGGLEEEGHHPALQ